jgi:hypothetical protein|tara:strand:- start:906 stop:1169 length:264 start_codon:yes stop_codon:yes gene_type:complete
MSFNLEVLKEELSKYGTVMDCCVYCETNLEIKIKNSTGRAVTYNRIENDLILPYFVKIDSRFGTGYYKGAFAIEDKNTEGLMPETIN